VRPRPGKFFLYKTRARYQAASRRLRNTGLAVQRNIPSSESCSVTGFSIIGIEPSDYPAGCIFTFRFINLCDYLYNCILIITNYVVYVSVTYYFASFNSFVNYYKPTHFYLCFPQDALPGCVIGTHFLNSNAVTDAVITMFKPFARSDIFQKVRL
jgi:hypothetical protein